MRWLIVGLVFFRAAFAANQTTWFEINAMDRGAQIASMISTLNASPYNIYQYEVAIQLLNPTAFPYAPYVVNGVIPYVVSATPATNDTLLIIKYLPKATNPQYLVVPVEQVVAVAYSTQQIPQTGFSSVYQNGIAPELRIDGAQRAADIQNVVTTMIGSLPYRNTRSTVSLFTTLSGPFYPAIYGGLIPQIQSIQLVSSNDSLMLVTFLSNQNILGKIVVAAEQVIGIVYYPTGS